MNPRAVPGTATRTNATSAPDPVPLLAVSELRVTFPGGVRAVRGVSFSLTPGEVLAVVGESGAGKSATALAVMGLLPTAAHVAGSVRFRGRELLGLGDRTRAAVRGRDIAMICQDQAFTPVYRIGAQIAEAVRLHARVPRRAAAERAVELLRLAEIPDAARVARAFPHELSGGLRRRAMIAMAMAGDPAVILADEPTAGLDPPVQAKVLDALHAHQARAGTALVLITHDLGVVAGRADRVLVLYAGRPVETGPVEEIFHRPRMPYTIALLNSVARLDRPHVRPSPITGPPPSATDPRPGCPFAPRCPIAAAECHTTDPPLRLVSHPGHHAACLRTEQTDTPDRVLPLPSADGRGDASRGTCHAADAPALEARAREPSVSGEDPRTSPSGGRAASTPQVVGGTPGTVNGVPGVVGGALSGDASPSVAGAAGGVLLEAPGEAAALAGGVPGAVGGAPGMVGGALGAVGGAPAAVGGAPEAAGGVLPGASAEAAAPVGGVSGAAGGAPGMVGGALGAAGGAPGAVGGALSGDGSSSVAGVVGGVLPDASAEAAAPAGGPQSAGWARTPRGGTVVLEVDGLVARYPLVKGVLFRRRTGVVRAVDGVRFDIRAGETLGLVGESGCGKTSTLMEILRLGTAQTGRVVVFGRDTATLSGPERRRLRGDVQIVFQDPLAALDPRMSVEAILAEPLRAHRRRDIASRVPELLRLTGLDPAHASRYPGELSGGQRQRVGIARALALEPRLLLMDEPFSALDVSVQAGIIALLRELKTRLGLSYLLAAHDLAAVRQLADRVAVMHQGRLVEIGAADAIYETPAHPYTRTLIEAVPLPDPHRERARRGTHAPTGTAADRPAPAPRRIPVPPGRSPDGRERVRGRIPILRESRADLPGCRFRFRCPAFEALAARERRRCADEEPVLRPLGSEWDVACHFAEGSS